MRLLFIASLLSLSSAYAQWLPVPNPDYLENIEMFLPEEDLLYCGTISGKVYYSSDHGSTWTLAVQDSSSSGYEPVVGMAMVGDWLLMSHSGFEDLNFRSHFDGYQWSPWEPMPYQDSEIYSFAVIGSRVFAIFEGEINYSDDYGATWVPAASPGKDIADIFAYQGYLFASTNLINDGSIYRSDDLGTSWTEVTGSLGSSYVSSHAYWQGRLLLSVYHYGGMGSTWSSTDFGDSWEQIVTLPTENNINGMAVSDDGRLAVGASSGYPELASIWLSDDLVSWENYTGDLPQASWPFNDLISQNGWFFKSGGTTTKYRAPHPAGSSVSPDPASSDQMTLAVSPNPFDGSTVLILGLGGWTDVELGVFDLSGRMVAILASGPMPDGEHSVRWTSSDDNGRPLSHGVYFVRLRTDFGSLTEKLVILD